MLKFKYHKISDVIEKYIGDISKTPPKALTDIIARDNVVFDLTDIEFISLNNLLDLFLAIDFCQSSIGPVILKLPALSGYDENLLMPIDEYNESRKIQTNLKSDDRNPRFIYSDSRYRVLSFCYHYGLFDALEWQRSINTVTIEGLDSDILGKLFNYSSTRKTGSRLLSLKTIRALHELESFRVSGDINAWLKSLPIEIAAAPIFTDGEFSHVFAYQLGLNIIEHSGSAWVGEAGANGAIAMRFLSKDKLWQLQDDLEGRSQLLNDSELIGILEICVGDRGNGIVNSLREAYDTYVSKYGLDFNSDSTNIVAFAFDEIGTRKTLGERLSGVHALHRILKCTLKYNGVLKIKTAGYEYVYDTSIASSIKRGENGIGIYPTDFVKCVHPFGTKFQILIPVKEFPKQPKIIKRYNTGAIHKSTSDKLKYKIVDVGMYLSTLNTADGALNIGLLRQHLVEEPQDVIVVYNFSGCDKDEDVVVKFLNSQHHVLQTRLCIAIQMDKNFAKSLRNRELMNVHDIDIEEYRNDLFYVLSVNNRILLCIDDENKKWWYGLGVNAYDEILNQCYESSKKYKIPFSVLDKGDVANLIVYFNSNVELFNYSKSADDISVECNLSDYVVDSIMNTVVSNKLDFMVKELECVEDKGFYKIPSSGELYRKFLQSAPLLQFDPVVYQISNWMAYAVNSLIDDSKSALLLTITAPAELLAKSIANTMIGIQVYVYNLGYQSALDEEMLFNSEDWSDIPTVIIADIVNSEKSISQLVEFTENKKLTLRGFVSLIRLQDNMDDNYSNSLYWDPPPGNGGGLPKFFVAEYQKPPIAKPSELNNLREDNFFIVEPHSLEAFSQLSLSGAFELSSSKGRKNQNRLTQLEEANALRFGHWISGVHHFMITTSINKILTDDLLGSNICNDILNKIRSSNIDIILMPLHSHIGDIIPRLTTAVKLASSKSVVFGLCLSTKAMATNSFYILPKPIKNIITKHADHVHDLASQKLNIMILDDAIATGRTLNTIVRAIILHIRKVVTKKSLKTSPVGLIHSYSIIDRQGRAKSTLLTGITKISCQGDDEWASEYNIELNFRHDRWLDVDMPVYDKDSCKICFERSQLQSLLSASFISEDHSAVHEIQKRIEELRPRSSEIPAFLKMNKKLLPIPILIGKNTEPVGSVELALWEINNLLTRGATFKTLLKEYQNIYMTYPAEFAENDIEEHQQFLIIEYLRTLTREWNKLNSQAEGLNWVRLLKLHIDKGGVIAKIALWETGRALVNSNKEYSEYLLSIFDYGLQRLANFDNLSDASGKKRENLYIGIILFILSNNYFENLEPTDMKIGKMRPTKELVGFVNNINTEKLDILNRIYFDEIVSFLHRANHSDNFMPALMSILNQTVRPGRHNHDHLLPSLLSSVLKNKAGKNEVRLIRDILSDMLHCIEIVDRRFFGIFNDDARSILPFYRKTIEQIIAEFGSCKYDVSEKSKSLVSKLYRHYPHQHNNPLYVSLKRTQVSVKHILDLTCMKCENRTPIIEVKLDDSCQNIEYLNVIAPDIKIIEELVSNFTVTSTITIQKDVSPKLFIKIVHVKATEAIGRIQLHFYTNFNSDKNAIINILNGPGIKEANTRTLELFRIKIFPTEESFDDYNMHMIFEFCIGFPL